MTNSDARNSDADIDNFLELRQTIRNIRDKITKSHQIIRSVAALISSNIVASVLTAIGGLLVARFLGPEVTGPFRAYTIPLTYLIFLHFGTWDGLWRQIPYYIGKEMPERVDALAAGGGAFNGFISIFVSFGFICCAVYSLAHKDFQGVAGWLSQAVYSWAIFYGGYLTSTYRTLNHFETLAKIQVTQTITGFLMVFLLPFLRFYGLCARYAAPSLLGLFLYHQKRPLKVRYRFNTKAIKELIKIGLPFSFWGNLYTSIWTATESALVLYFAGSTALGLFSVAAVMRKAASSLPKSVLQVLTPRIITAFAKDGSVRNANARLIWTTASLTGFMMVAAVAGSFLLDIFVPYFIPKYSAGVGAMKVCLWFPVVEAAFLPINTIFAAGKHWVYGRGILAGMIVFPLSTYLLYPSFGGLLAVVFGSLFGRIARTLAAYVDLAVLTRREA